MLLRYARWWAVLCLLLVVHRGAGVHGAEIVRRQDDAPSSTTTVAVGSTASTDSERTATEDMTLETTAKPTRDETDAPESTEQPRSRESSPTSEEQSATTTVPSPNAESTGDSTYLNGTIPEGQLPLPPRITPGWGVAGTIMLLSGLAYTVIGIKNHWIHTFLSTAYLTSLGISVLIVYVMTVPVSDALQGGYVAAIILSGCTVGVGSVFFRELTEGLGCALGGFCLSMWLLCLVPGGLLTPGPPRAIFVACFTVFGFAFYFSRFTRDWALILMISFAGATVTVLGIDCFSRAGLKEFWAYVWDLNDNLFPLGADTYPVTKGIRVETAAVIIIFLLGIVSQIKLWRVVREKREKRAVERAEGQRNLEEEETNVGLQIEELNKRERRQWERVHGNGEGSSDFSHESTVEFATEEKSRSSQSDMPNPLEKGEAYEMTNLSESDAIRPVADSLMASAKNEAGRVTVRVATEDLPEGFPYRGGQTIDGTVIDSQGPNVTRALSSSADPRQVSGTSISEPPQVVALPFTIPQEEDVKSQGDRSSVATFADEEEMQPVRRFSLANRLSRSSGKLLRNLSHRSGRRSIDGSLHGGESREDLVLSKAARDGDSESLAATLDDSSVCAQERHSYRSVGKNPRIEINAQLQEEQLREQQPSPTEQKIGLGIMEQTGTPDDNKSTGVTDTLDIRSTGDQDQPKTNRTSGSFVDEADSNGMGPTQIPKSATTDVSAPVSLTKDRLPRSLSRVALSYRTNEWAKHLSQADTPKHEELHVADAQEAARREPPAPVDVDDLQKTSTEKMPLPRSNSQLSVVSHLSKTIPSADRPPAATTPTVLETLEPGPESAAPLPSSQIGVSRSLSATSFARTSRNFQPIIEEQPDGNTTRSIPEESGDMAQSSNNDPSTFAALMPQRSPSVPGVVSYASPQTLLGQRDMFLRNKSQGNLAHDPPEAGIYQDHDRMSDTGSIMNYPMYAAALSADPDDVPLSQRKEMMRHGSMLSLNSQQQPLPRANSSLSVRGNASFNSHQPTRGSTLPTHAAREAQLANFRTSVAADLEAGSPMMSPSGRATPFASTTNLLGGRETEIQRNIDSQRSKLLSQKEAEVQRKEMSRREKEWADQAFNERMRSGDLMDAHRQAMRKMQRSAKDQ